MIFLWFSCLSICFNFSDFLTKSVFSERKSWFKGTNPIWVQNQRFTTDHTKTIIVVSERNKTVNASKWKR